MSAPKKCTCRGAVLHALDPDEVARVRLQRDAATLAGRDMLAGYYSQRLSACSTAAPSLKQRAVMADAAIRAGAVA